MKWKKPFGIYEGANMKHICFDESSVLTEFARIAQENKLIKTAAGELSEFVSGVKMQPATTYTPPQGRGDIVPAKAPSLISPITKTPASEQNQFDGLLAASFPSIFEVYRTGRAKKFDAILNELRSSEWKRFAKGWLEGSDQYASNKIKEIKSKLRNFLGQVKRQKMTPQQQQAYIPAIDEQLQSLSNAEHDLTKEGGVESLYDVSGETGEDLINSAHPEGSPKVKETKKTDEVIETVIDQQKKDLEIISKRPTGKYAELIRVYGDLKKLGATEDELKVVKEYISKVASLDNIINHILIILADHLDEMGLNKYADQVDKLVKLAGPQAKAYLDFVSDKVRGIGTMGAKSFADLIKQIKSNITLEEAMRLVDEKSAENKGIEEYGQIRVAIDDGKSKFNEALIAERSTKPESQIEFPTTFTGDFQMGEPEAEMTAKKKRIGKSKRVERFQVLFNEWAKQVGWGVRLNPDGIWGPKTSSAWNQVGGDKGLELKMRELSLPALPEQKPTIAPKADTTQYESWARLQLPANIQPAYEQSVKQWVAEAVKDALKAAETGYKFKDVGAKDKYIKDLLSKRIKEYFTKEQLSVLMGK